jgi:hypothetical protein
MACIRANFLVVLGFGCVVYAYTCVPRVCEFGVGFRHIPPLAFFGVWQSIMPCLIFRSVESKGSSDESQKADVWYTMGSCFLHFSMKSLEWNEKTLATTQTSHLKCYYLNTGIWTLLLKGFLLGLFNAVCVSKSTAKPYMRARNRAHRLLHHLALTLTCIFRVRK